MFNLLDHRGLRPQGFQRSGRREISLLAFSTLKHGPPQLSLVQVATTVGLAPDEKVTPCRRTPCGFRPTYHQSITPASVAVAEAERSSEVSQFEEGEEAFKEL